MTSINLHLLDSAKTIQTQKTFHTLICIDSIISDYFFLDETNKFKGCGILTKFSTRYVAAIP